MMILRKNEKAEETRCVIAGSSAFPVCSGSLDRCVTAGAVFPLERLQIKVRRTAYQEFRQQIDAFLNVL